MADEARLIERTRRSLGEHGQMRIKSAHWREEFDEVDEIEYDLVELPDGSNEIRIRPVKED